MHSLLNTDVTCFKSYSSLETPVIVNLLQWLTDHKYEREVAEIRATDAKQDRDRLKAKLPAITPCGIFSRRGASYLIRHSRFIQVDIDFKDNQHILNYANLKAELCKIKNVAYCGLSVSGKGYWLLIPISNPSKHSDYFSFIVTFFAQRGIKIDQAPRNVSSLRGYSFDPNAYFNHNALILTEYRITSTTQTKYNKASINTFTKQPDEIFSNDVNSLIQQVVLKKVDLTQTYNNWLALGFAFAKAYGEPGRNLFHQISQFHPKYDVLETDKKFTSFLNSNGTGNLQVLFNLCKQAGIRPIIQYPVIY